VNDIEAVGTTMALGSAITTAGARPVKLTEPTGTLMTVLRIALGARPAKDIEPTGTVTVRGVRTVGTRPVKDAEPTGTGTTVGLGPFGVVALVPVVPEPTSREPAALPWLTAERKVNTTRSRSVAPNVPRSVELMVKVKLPLVVDMNCSPVWVFDA